MSLFNTIFIGVIVFSSTLLLSQNHNLYPTQIPEIFVLDSVLTVSPPFHLQVLFIGGHDIVSTQSTYQYPAGQTLAKEGHDFIGITPDTTGQSLCWVSVNHELNYKDDRLGDGGGMTTFRIKRMADGNLEVMEQQLADGRKGKFFNVDFVNTVGETGMNCGGIQSRDGRIWTAEEWFKTDNRSIYHGEPNDRAYPVSIHGITEGQGVRDTTDFIVQSDIPGWNGFKLKKYQNFNWFVEIDPRQAKAIRKQYNWGRAGWEGGAIANDEKTIIFGNDEAPTALFKFTTEIRGDFSKGRMYFFKHDNPAGKKWVVLPDNPEFLIQNINDYAITQGATMFLRNEWVTTDKKTGIMYWSETGKDDGGKALLSGVLAGGVLHPVHQNLAKQQGLPTAAHEQYEDPFGRVWYYHPGSDEIGVAIHGGPSKTTADFSYPRNHLSNPDGLTTIVIDGETFLVICEDLNGLSHGRVPPGVQNKTCEVYLLPIKKAKDATADDLIRISAVPRGAEVTGASVTPDGRSLLLNVQHPDFSNSFPYNHSLLYAIHGFDKIKFEKNERKSHDKKSE
jgi:secreted PhoX family phosphatase